MKNFKKLFAIVATAAMLTTMVNTSTFAAGYSDELQGAYDYAYGIGATTQSTIDSANMYGNLIRAHAAKILVNYAKEVLNRTPDTSVEVNFSDIADQSTELQGYIVEAAQLGIMGVNPDGSVADKFNPNGVVTRAQFGTVLSRILYGDKNEGGTPYYMNHLNALKDAGIMKNVSNPDATEVRGYVFLMLQRAAEGTDVSETCSQPDVIFACTLGTSACPEECKDAVVDEEANGNLGVKLAASEGAEVPYGVSSLPVATYKFTADEDVRIDSITFKLAGVVTKTDVTNLTLFKDGTRISKTSATWDSTASTYTVNISNGYTVKAGEPVEFAVNATIANLSGAGGSKFTVALTSVDSTAEDVDYASDLTSETFKVLSKANDSIEFASFTSATDVKSGEEGAELFDFTLKNNNTQSATFKTITFKQVGSIDMEDLSNFKLIADGEVIATTESANGKYVGFSIEDGYAIDDKSNQTFTVKADVTGGAGETIDFDVESVSDLVVLGDTYDAPLLNAGLPATGLTAIDVSAGKVTVTKVIADAGDLVSNTDNIFVGAFKIENNADKDLSFQKLSLSLTNTGTTGFLETVKVRLGSTSASPVELTQSGSKAFYYENDLDKTIKGNGSLTVYVYVDTLETGMDGKNIKLSLPQGSLYIEESQNDTPVIDISYPSDWALVEGKDSSLTLTNVALGNKTFSKGTSEIDAVSFKIKAGTTAGAKIKKLTFTTSGNAVTTDTIKGARLYNGTTEIAASVKTNGQIVVDDDFTIAAGKTAALVLKVDLASNPKVTTGVQYILSTGNVSAEDTTSDKNTLYTDKAGVGRVISVISAGTITTSYDDVDNNQYNKTILAGESKVVAEYNVYSKYEAAKVKTLTVNFTGAIQSSVNDIEVYYGDKLVAQDPEWTSSSVAVFKDLTDFTTELTDTALTIKVVSKTITEDGGVSVANTKISSIVLADVTGKDSGEIISGASLTISSASKAFSIVPVSVTAAVTTKGTTVGNFSLTTTAGSNTTSSGAVAKATITKVVFDLDGNNGGLTKLTLKDANGTVLGSGDISASDSMKEITLDSGKVLSNGTATWSIAATLSGSINTPTYNVALNKVVYTTAGSEFTSELGTSVNILSK